MRFIGRWLKRLLIAAAVALAALAAPILYVETMCGGEPSDDSYAALLPPEHHRPETRTFMTYPEWHIVHAYADYAEVLRDGDPHDYGFTAGIAGFWSSLCTLTEVAEGHGDIDWGTKQMVYVIGASFTAELAMKALYEETLGRLSAALRGPERSPLDALSAEQAADYAAFLQQVPWYRWPFREDAAALTANAGTSWRDWERERALGLEYRAKAAYAGVIADAVASVGADELTLRMIVAGVPADQLAAIESITVIETRAEGIEVETPRYRALTLILAALAADGATFIEIAGNDDILFTAISPDPTAPAAIFSAPRQGFGDHRHLIFVPVRDLAEALTGLSAQGLTLEHIHDY